MSTNEPPVGPDPQEPDPSVPPPPPPSYGSTQYPPPGAGDAGGSGGFGGFGGSGAGYPPPPPSDPGYAEPFSAPSAIGFGWKKFTANIGNWLIAGLVVFALIVLFALVSWLVGPKYDSQSTANGIVVTQTGGSRVLSWLVQIAGSIVAILFTAVLVRGALDETEGRKFELGTTFSRIPAGTVIVTAIIVGLAVSVLSIIPFLGAIAGIVIQFFTWFAITYVVDKGLDPISGIKASATLVAGNIGQSLLLALLSVLVVLLGCCGLLSMVTVPIVAIASAYAYKKFQNEPVTA